ncbi:PKD domain-containing protein [Pseudonocardiaceae bacterium YIM PH 21723]|nr:PKD domain-containing protein [Pseudonocardiaceae bacterium YIM PH 21723]
MAPCPAGRCTGLRRHSRGPILGGSTMHTRISVLATALALVAGALLPGIAHAAPVANDDFDQATAVTALPFTQTQDASGATKASDDPFRCTGYELTNTVWFRYTATDNGLLRFTAADAGPSTVISVHTGGRGSLDDVEGGCSTDGQATFQGKAGTTYQIMISGWSRPLTTLTVGLDRIAPAANDNWSGAQPIDGLPFAVSPDLSVASPEADEPASACEPDRNKRSVWYRYTTAESRPILLGLENYGYQYSAAIYTGDSITSLTELTCYKGSQYEKKSVRANPGTTYYVRFSGEARNSGSGKLTLSETPPLDPSFYISSEATVFSDVQFRAESWNAFDKPMTSRWDFGDGSSSPATTEAVSHRYAKDGEYKITLNTTAPDGRSATKTTTVTVNTHDVAITRFDVPKTARAGQSVPITVHIGNTRYTEKPTVILYRSKGDSWEAVGSSTLDVPAHPSRTVKFPFSYTVTDADAAIGKVTFRAVVQLTYPIRDARPMDNEVIALATTIKGRS